MVKVLNSCECIRIMRLRGIEPPHVAPEATALSTELQTHLLYYTVKIKKCKYYFKKILQKILQKSSAA